MDELVEIEATAEGTIVEVIGVVEPKDAVEPVKTRIVEWLDERTFRSSQVAADPLCPAGAAVR